MAPPRKPKFETKAERDRAIYQEYKARKRTGVTRKDLAKKHRLSVNTVGRILWEQGTVKGRASKRKPARRKAA